MHIYSIHAINMSWNILHIFFEPIESTFYRVHNILIAFYIMAKFFFLLYFFKIDFTVKQWFILGLYQYRYGMQSDKAVI